MRVRWAIPLAALFLAAAALAGVAQPHLGRSANTPLAGGTITVGGSGSISVVPDRASFDFTVETRGATAALALGRNAAETTAVVGALKAAGVADSDLQTSQVSLSPQTSEDGTRVLGYVASNTLTAETSIARAGALVDAAVGAGATGVSGPSLSRSDEQALTDEALKDAVANAHEKAAALASAAGLTLGKAKTIVEGESEAPIPYAAAARASVTTPIEPGTQTVDATVTVTYETS